VRDQDDVVRRHVSVVGRPSGQIVVVPHELPEVIAPKSAVFGEGQLDLTQHADVRRQQHSEIGRDVIDGVSVGRCCLVRGRRQSEALKNTDPRSIRPGSIVVNIEIDEADNRVDGTAVIVDFVPNCLLGPFVVYHAAPTYSETSPSAYVSKT